MYILSCYDVKDVDCSIFSKNVHLHKMYYISGSGVDRRGRGERSPFLVIKKLLFDERINLQQNRCIGR